ncbi:PREDICTED: actin-binding protein anillin isoform X2 [Vollenhovia emeryi]|uniref:actin-binding protein anillin isoform X2 n=1 Tax=Vollenhovia emeryi TaxID=411798 RepID=UPI0005F3848C|nr:PREDICTED: actin-binding protein anillin isoform X2 [Vollenhovia emeryi]
MESFVQRMLERAKVRREKLDEKLTNAGHDVQRRPSPLRNANALLEQATAASENLAKSPVKAAAVSALPAKSPRKSPVSKNVAVNNEQDNKENGKCETSNARAKLQRLGKLYSEDNNLGLSSPIHRTEEKFSAEESNAECKSIKKGARLNRFVALASNINSWEDDLSHPSSKIKAETSKAEKIQAKFNEQVKSGLESQPSTSESKKWVTINNGRRSKDPSPVKQLKWDKTTLENLEAQGFSRTKSNSRLVYDYKHCSQESNGVTSHLSPNKFTSSARQQMEKKRISPGRSDGSPRSKKADGDVNVTASPSNSSRTNDSKVSSTPEKFVKSANTTSSSRLPSRTLFSGSPKTLIQPSGSVLSKASMFEAKNTESKAKDPAQMTLAERMALFERNKGEALIPKAPLTMSIPPKKLQEKDKQSNADLSPMNSRNADGPSKTVFEQRAMFEQGNNRNRVEEMENRILQATHAERQRELSMLRSRFNANKEVARTAAGSCVRTSESSEGGGKPSSPKNSPVCQVKPTPAPDHIAPPPPPPLPHPEIISYHSKSSPVKRQVAGSPPKVPHLNATSDIKRIRVCPPKPGALYPNLSEIENTESDSDSEYTVDSTEPVTATLDEKTETETETASEDDYYIRHDETDQETESDQESVQNSSFGRTSFGRSILQEFDERSLFNKKRCIEPDPDSTTSDISVLDEMEQYLDECLDEELGEVREEGPTPPKVNKGGEYLSTRDNSKYCQSYRSPLKDSHKLEDGGKRVPLVRTVSAYRRQQSQLAKNNPVARYEMGSNSVSERYAKKREDESVLVENKVKKLLDEVGTQQKKIEEASKALNLCHSTVEFNGSSEHVGGEWALLVATHKRQAALNEVQRLKREGTLIPVKAGSPEVEGNGSLTISAITLPLKQEYFRSMGMNTYLHCVCLMYYLGDVVATQAATAEPGDSCIRFTSMLKLDNLHSDFEIVVEVYTFQTQPKYLPHEKKYHISHTAKSVNKTPKKKNQFVMPDIQSPAGPNAIRSPAFELSGTATVTLGDINREQFTLLEASSHSPLEGHLRMRISRKLSVSVEYRGFLTLYEDITNLGAWRRRWCWLKDAKLYCWVHPEDEHKKNPISCLNLEDATTKQVRFINMEKCARPYTFLVEISRQAQPGDTDNLITKTDGKKTTTSHKLLADSKEEGLQWISKLNKTLSLIRAWGSSRSSVY